MKNKVFISILLSVVIVCAVLTAAHALYALYLYRHCSIIYFISKELW